MEKTSITRKLLALALCLVVAVTFIPLFGDGVYATDEEGQSEEVTNDVVVDEPSSEDAVENPTEEPADGIDITTEEPAEVTPAEGEGIDAIDELDESIDENEYSAVDYSLLLGGSEIEAKATTRELNEDVYSFSVSRSGNKLTINASFKAGYQRYTYNNAIYTSGFKKINVDGSTFDIGWHQSLSNYPVTLSNTGGTGYHYVILTAYGLKDNTSSTYHETGNSSKRYYRVGIKAAPSAGTPLSFYHDRFDYGPTWDGNIGTNGLRLIIEYNGVMSPAITSYASSGSVYGLVPSTNYSVCTYYGKYVNGELFTGKEEGYVLNLGTYTTGVGSGVAVKSIKVKAYNVKKKKQKIYGYYTGLYLGSTKYYKYKLKIIVKLKKKPGTPYIWINGKTYKGNKKSYTVKLGTFTSYSKPKGKKYTVAIYKFLNGSYGGYSPMYTKVKKIK